MVSGNLISFFWQQTTPYMFILITSDIKRDFVAKQVTENQFNSGSSGGKVVANIN